MKYTLFIFLFILFNGHSQDTLFFFDKDSKKSLYFVQLFDKTNELIAISDLNGRAIIDENQSTEFIAKHLDYKTEKINTRQAKTFYLKSNILVLGDVVIKPTKGKSLLYAILDKSATTIPENSFHGKMKIEARYFQYIPDSSSRAKEYDTVYTELYCELDWYYLRNEKNKKVDLIYQPKNAIINHYSNVSTDYIKYNPLRIYDFFLGPEYAFAGDFVESEVYEKFLGRNKYKISKDTTNALLIKKKEENFDYNAKLDYEDSDSIIRKFEEHTIRIKANVISSHKFRVIEYDENDSIFFLKRIINNHYSKFGYHEITYTISDVRTGTAENVNTNFDLSEYLDTISVNLYKFDYNKITKNILDINIEQVH